MKLIMIKLGKFVFWIPRVAIKLITYHTRLLTSILIGGSNCALVPVDVVHEIDGALKRFQGAVSSSVGSFLYDCSFGSSFRYLSIS